MKHKRSGRVTALLLSAVLTLCLLPLPVRAAGAETGVQLGDYIQLGRYDGEPILWRCVTVLMAAASSGVKPLRKPALPSYAPPPKI